MILFASDFQYYPNAIVDVKTTNTSFLRLATIYREMGIKNHAFILALHNPELQGVDPFSPNLTVREMAMIGVECKQNFWYIVREILRAPALAGTDPSMVEANRGNIALWWCFFKHITFVLVQPRQTGKSFSTDALMTSLMNFICNNTKINLVTKDDTLRTENIARLKAIYEELPSYLNFKTRADANNTEALTVERFGNKYITHVPQASPKRAYNTGRGLTTPIVQIDEGPFQVNIEIAMEAMLAAMGAACDYAEAAGEPYGTIFTTTAGKKDSPEGKYVYNFACDGALWTEKYLDCANDTELKEMVCRNSKKGVFRIYGNFSYKQLGKTDAWLKDKLDRSNQGPEAANRDYFGIWTSGTQSSPLPIHILETLTKSIKEAQTVQIQPIGKYILRWFIPENEIDQYMATHKVVISIDTSDAAGNDEISFEMTDVETGELIAISAINETNLITYAQWLVYILAKYENTTMIIERRSSAITIIDYLFIYLVQRGIDPFKRLFNWVINDPMEHKSLYDEAMLPMRRRSEDIYVRAKKYFGFATSGGGQTSRADLYSVTLQNAAKRCATKVKDRTLTEQITGLIIRNGRVDHEIGEHDDLVISWLLAHWFLTMAKNLIHYGIEAKQVLVEHREKVNFTPAQAYFVMEQAKIREKIELTYERLMNETDIYIVQRLEQELYHLDTKIVLEDGEYYSVDALITEASDKRKNKNTATNGISGKNYYERLGYATNMPVVSHELTSAPLANSKYW